MGRIINLAVVVFLVLFFIVTSIHSCSEKGKSVTYNAQAGERLLYFLDKENLSKDILDVDSFKYYRIDLTLDGDVDKYKKFVIKYGYVRFDNFTFCKDGNSIKLFKKDTYTLLKYSYDDQYCR